MRLWRVPVILGSPSEGRRSDNNAHGHLSACASLVGTVPACYRESGGSFHTAAENQTCMIRTDRPAVSQLTSLLHRVRDTSAPSRILWIISLLNRLIIIISLYNNNNNNNNNNNRVYWWLWKNKTGVYFSMTLTTSALYMIPYNKSIKV